MVKRIEATEICQGCNHVVDSVVHIYILIRIGGSVADVKKWIAAGSPADLIGKLQMLIGDAGSTNLQRLFTGLQLSLTVMVVLTMGCVV